MALNIFKELKETMSKELKENRKRIPQQIENINKEIEITKRNQIEILLLECIITEMNNLLEEFNCRFGHAGERISELEDVLNKIIQPEEQKEKRKLKYLH